ncbi:MAG: peptidylprolyl isomerase [Oscillochloris sp.]|nr:peptidylprolyl isomerase [Oscillochloris sp.]
MPPKERSKAQGTPPATSRPLSRKRLAHHEREVRSQRQVVIATATALGFALLALIIGLSYDQLWIPSRPVAQVGNVTLSRNDYWKERRTSLAREVAQNFQLVAIFGGNQQFTQQFANQSPSINLKVKSIRNDPVDDSVVNAWETLQLKEQGAGTIGISVSQDAINQAIAADLGLIFIPPPAPPITTTATISQTTTAPVTDATAAVSVTATLEPTSTPLPTATPEPTATSSPTPGGPTATAAPTSTPEPTSTPQPTPEAAEAATQVDQIVDEIFRRYELELASFDDKPILTKDDFRAGLITQYREQVLNTRVQESLVPEQSFTLSDEPQKVHARQILIQVSPPDGATPEQIDALFNDEKDRADELLTQLRGGADFAELAKTNSDDLGSANTGGDIGLFDKDGKADNGATYPPELVTAAFDLAINTVSDPIRTEFGWHIIEVTERQVPAKDEQLRDARTKALDTWLTEQRTKIAAQRFPTQTPTPSDVTETPTTVPTYVPGPPTEMPTLEPTIDPTAAALEAIPSPTATAAVSPSSTTAAAETSPNPTGTSSPIATNTP